MLISIIYKILDGNEIGASIAVLDSDSHNELQVCVARSRRTNRVGLNAGGGVGWLSPNGVFR